MNTLNRLPGQEVRPNKKISVFQVAGLENFRYGRHTYIFFWKKI